MYETEQMEIIDKLSTRSYENRREMDRTLRNIILSFSEIDDSGLEIDSSIFQDEEPVLMINISYPTEFGAGFELRYDLGKVYFSMGASGKFSAVDNPKQCLIIKLMSSFVDNNDILTELLDVFTAKYNKRLIDIEQQFKDIDDKYEGLRYYYFNSDMFKERAAKRI